MRCNYEGGHTWRWHNDIPGGCWECLTCQEKVSGRPDSPPPPDHETLITLGELAQLTDLQHYQLRRAAREGRLTSRKSGALWLSSMAAVEEALEVGTLQRRPGRPSKI